MKMRQKTKGSVWLNHKSTALGFGIASRHFMACNHTKHVHISVMTALSTITAPASVFYELINCQPVKLAQL